MDTVIDLLNKMVDARKEYLEFKALKDRCFKIFETHPKTRIDYLKKIVDNDWAEMYDYISDTPGENIWRTYWAMRHGTSREEARQEMSITISLVREVLKEKKRNEKDAEKAFIEKYETYFKKKDKAYYSFLLYPKVEELLKDFLSS